MIQLSPKPQPAAAAVQPVHVHIHQEGVNRFTPAPAAAMTDRPRFRAAVKADGTLELMVYGEIVDDTTMSLLEYYGVPTDGFVSAMNVKRALDSAGSSYSRVMTRINSPGGDAFAGIAIKSLLASQSKPWESCVDGIAASAASIIAVGSKDGCKMGRGAMMMIHDAWTYAAGNKSELRKTADTLDKIDESIAQVYAARSGKALSEIQTMMSEETWLTAEDCVSQGFAAAIIEDPEEPAALAQAREFQALNRFRRVPKALGAKPPRDAAPIAPKAQACACECDACMEGDCSNCSNRDCTDENCQNCPMQNPDAANSNLTLYQCKTWQEHRGIRAQV